MQLPGLDEAQLKDEIRPMDPTRQPCRICRSPWGICSWLSFKVGFINSHYWIWLRLIIIVVTAIIIIITYIYVLSVTITLLLSLCLSLLLLLFIQFILSVLMVADGTILLGQWTPWLCRTTWVGRRVAMSACPNFWGKSMDKSMLIRFDE